MVWSLKQNASVKTPQTSFACQSKLEKTNNWSNSSNGLIRPIIRPIIGRPRTRWTEYIEDLGQSRLGLHPNEMMNVMEDREV